jgi:hypothetical protein
LHEPWRAWADLIDGSSYFDFAQTDGAQGWTIYPTQLTALIQQR